MRFYSVMPEERWDSSGVLYFRGEQGPKSSRYEAHHIPMLRNVAPESLAQWPPRFAPNNVEEFVLRTYLSVAVRVANVNAERINDENFQVVGPDPISDCIVHVLVGETISNDYQSCVGFGDGGLESSRYRVRISKEWMVLTLLCPTTMISLLSASNQLTEPCIL